jgi:uncharacterized protein YoxC
MLEIILGIGVAAFIVYASFTIDYLMSLKRTSMTLEAFIKRTEGNLMETLDELKVTIENVRKITANVNNVTDDVKKVSHAVANMDKGVWALYGYLKKGLGPKAEANIAGLRAGIKTGVVTLVKNLQSAKEGSKWEKTS